MKKTVELLTICGVKCFVEHGPRKVVITVTEPRRHEIEASDLKEGALLLGHWLYQRGATRGKVDQHAHLEQSVRQALKLMRLPKDPVPISGRHVVPSSKGKRPRFVVRRAMYGHKDQKIYFGTYTTEHRAAEMSRRLCEIINEEIEVRARLLSLKVSEVPQ